MTIGMTPFEMDETPMRSALFFMKHAPLHKSCRGDLEAFGTPDLYFWKRRSAVYEQGSHVDCAAAHYNLGIFGVPEIDA